MRLDIFTAGRTGITRSRVLNMIHDGLIKVNGTAENPGYRMRPSDAVSVSMPAPHAETLTPEDIPLPVLHMDADLAVVVKPAGMVVYPAAGHDSGTIMNALAFHAPHLASVGGPMRPGVVHRLDRDTSGVMVVALSDEAYYSLVEQFRERTIERKYLALVYGSPRQDDGEISLSIGRSDSDRKKMSTRTRRGKAAVTRWKVARRFGTATLIEARLGTGRTHQIRVHFAAIGHPVLGDQTYGKKTRIETVRGIIPVHRQMLHAETLGFIHPRTGTLLRFSSPMPADMQHLMELLP